MTTSDVLNYCKAMMNEEGAITPNWSDTELFRIVEKKCNEALSFLGLVDTKTTTLSVAGQADYNYPTNMIRIRRIWYSGMGLKYITIRQYESRQPGGIAPSGTPREFTLYNNVITLTPVPSVSNDTITIFGESQQTSITSSSVSIDIPSVFHGAICDGVISEMFAKDLNSGFYDRFNNKWNDIHIPSMREFARRRRRRGLPTTVIDSDSLLETEFGVI
jgi:hypothetical protein